MTVIYMTNYELVEPRVHGVSQSTLGHVEVRRGNGILERVFGRYEVVVVLDVSDVQKEQNLAKTYYWKRDAINCAELERDTLKYGTPEKN